MTAKYKTGLNNKRIIAKYSTPKASNSCNNTPSKQHSTKPINNLDKGHASECRHISLHLYKIETKRTRTKSLPSNRKFQEIYRFTKNVCFITDRCHILIILHSETRLNKNHRDQLNDNHTLPFHNATNYVSV